MAYAETTKVPFERSIAEIITMIRKAGADQIGQLESSAMFTVQFTLDGRMIRFRVPFATLDEIPELNGRGIRLSSSQRLEKLDQSRRQRGRALMLVIKAKLESVESGVETLEQAFLANVVLSDGATVHERISGNIAIEYQQGRPNAAHGLLPPPAA